MKSPVYYPRANELDESAAQTVNGHFKRGLPTIMCHLEHSCKRALMAHRNNSKTRSKTPVELLLGRRVRLPAIADFDSCEPILLKASEKTKIVPATFIISKGLNTSLLQPENSTRTIRVSDNPIARLDEDKMKTEPAVEETISESEPQLQNTYVGPSHLDEASVVTSSAKHQQPEPPEPSRISTRNRKQLDRFGVHIPQTCLKKEGACDGFKQSSRNSEISLKFQGMKEEHTWQTLSIRNDHRTILNSNSVLELSLSCWPINHLSKLNSPTNRNMILTTTALQLMNSTVPRPYMILIKCWWKSKITSGIRNLNLFACQSCKIFLAHLNFLCLISHR